MEDGKTDEGDTEGKEDDKSTEENKTDISIPTPNTSLEEAKEINKETKELLDRREKIVKREEDLHAAQMVGGHTVGGQEAVKPEQISDSDYADKFMKGEANPLGEDGISLD